MRVHSSSLLQMHSLATYGLTVLMLTVLLIFLMSKMLFSVLKPSTAIIVLPLMYFFRV